MIFENFEMQVIPIVSFKATCKCGTTLENVKNGFYSQAMYCPKCENVYLPKLIKLPASKVTDEFLEQCRKQLKK